ncbi:MAG: Eco57I restriction-modification methylase domain-containing protein [Candidatus Anammoxibacter sp.]
MAVPAKILELIERFDRNIEAYKQGSYNETQIRREFIDPFFEELGWDVSNKNGYAEAYKDVVHEDAIKVGKATKAPDYGFRIGGTRKFFLEAKKPSVNIKEDTHPAYQLRRYAWSAKLPLSILTDFEEFAVYDCRAKPVNTDKASHSRILYFKYNDYPERWEEITGIFSRDAILKGSFDKYAESKKGKRGTAEVDESFLVEIERWRDILARNIALRNSNLTQRELNFTVQRTIDRIVFLRICEDRGIEPYGTLRELKNGDNVYRKLFDLFRKADDKYNSGIFHFKDEKGRSDTLDALTPDIIIDDKVVKDVINNLYYPESPYEFSVLPADILGQVYEQFLGKVIRLTPAHHAIIEDKPEVKKAGGIYYTPTYIVDYIVKQTVCKLVEGKKPGPQGGVSKLRILDPACGSGSFLIGAYQFLLDWHRDQYMNDDPQKWATGKTPRVYQASGGEWKLTTDERKRILLNNIYGVDIDPQAVEVTKLSLLLKVLEGESEQTLGSQLLLFQERVLPDLHNNIKCGNSLIGPDFYHGKQMALLDEDEMYRINTFDWNTEFQEIMKNGGFDAVIGNPPYGALFSDEEITHLKKNYHSFEYQINSFVLFMDKGIKVLNKFGKISYITPAVFLTQHYFKNIRKIILDDYSIDNILILNYKVFKDADTGDTCVFVLSNDKSKNNFIKYSIINREAGLDNLIINEIKQNEFLTNSRYEIYISANKKFYDKVNKISVTLGELADCIMGIKPYQKGKGFPKQTEQTVKNRIFDSRTKENDLYRAYLIGKDINRYLINPLEQRYIKFGKWLAEPRFTAPFEKVKIVLRQTSDRIRAVLDNGKLKWTQCQD